VTYPVSLPSFTTHVRKIVKSDYWLSHVRLPASLSVHPSVRMEQVVSHSTDFLKICYLRVFSKIWRENCHCIKIWQG